MKKEDLKVVITTKGKSVETSADVLHQLARTLRKNEYNLSCPRCHSKDFRQWHWLKRVMHKCNKCGRIWSYDAAEITKDVVFEEADNGSNTD